MPPRIEWLRRNRSYVINFIIIGFWTLVGTFRENIFAISKKIIVNIYALRILLFLLISWSVYLFIRQIFFISLRHEEKKFIDKIAIAAEGKIKEDLDSVENKLNDRIDKEFITSLCLHFFRRIPDKTGLLHWINEYKKLGRDKHKITKSMTESKKGKEEFRIKGIIETEFQSEKGRKPSPAEIELVHDYHRRSRLIPSPREKEFVKTLVEIDKRPIREIIRDQFKK